MNVTETQVILPGRDHITLSVEIQEGQVLKSHLEVIGCLPLIELVQKWRPQIKGPWEKIPLPEGCSHEALLLREILLKAQGRWELPYTHEELCHCRKVTTETVDQAILQGAQDVESLRRWTTACTGCGSCQSDIEKMIAYRCGVS